MDEHVNPPDRTVGEYLHDLYSSVLVELWNAWTDRTTVGGAPAFSWLQPEGSPTTATERLLTAAHIHCGSVGINMMAHVKVLIRAYPTRVTDAVAPADHHWPGLASFTVARGILEGSAQVLWLLDGSVLDAERACRLARLMTWSERYGNQAKETTDGHQTEGIVDAVREAGMHINGIRVDGEGFSITRVIENSFGADGTDWYNHWSAAAHHGPWKLAPSQTLEFRDDDPGAYGSAQALDSLHIDLAADVARIVSEAVRAWVTYWGRDARVATTGLLGCERQARGVAEEFRRDPPPAFGS